MKIKEISKSLGFVMLIGKDPLLIEALLQEIMSSLEVILFLGKVRNKM